MDGPLGVALFFSVLIPLIQIALHVWAKSGLFTSDPTGQQTGVGVLYNLPDSLSYASWAAQAKLGYVTFIDLFTTDPHARALFNLYFLAVGLLSRLTGIDPLPLMEFLSLLLGPAAAFVILLIARALRFKPFAQGLSIVLVLLGSGISGLLVLLDAQGLPSLRFGADAYYLDLFPLPSLIFYPYHAATFVLLALIVLVAIRMFAEADGPGPLRRAVLLGGLFLVTGLVRPYEVVPLALVFNLTALFGLVVDRGRNLGRTLVACCIVDVLAFPPVAYSAFMATRPVWGSFAQISMEFETGGALAFLKGFGILWTLAIIGLAFAIADRKRDLVFAACWAIVAAALLLLSPYYGTKFAGGSVLPNGLLAAYGVGRLMQQESIGRWGVAGRRLVLGAIGLMFLTPIVVFADIAKVDVPTVDRELLAAGTKIRSLEGTRIPVVLTGVDAGAVLAGLFGDQVYAGHWSLTPDYLSKREHLKRGGLEASAPDSAEFDRALLADLVRRSRAEFIVVKRSAPVARAIATCSTARPVYEGERWVAVRTAGWSCP